MLKQLLFLLTASLLYTSQTRAQAFEPGLLVRSTGDTLRGEIENGFWTEPPAFIRYRSTPDSPSQLFQPRQLRAVSFTGGRYFRYEALPIDYAAETRLDYLSRGYVPAVRPDSVLAEVIVSGEASLLRVATPGTVHYLLRRSSRDWLDLSAHKYLHESADGAMIVFDANNYLGQLSVYFGDCPAAAEAAKTLPFTLAGLTRVVQVYNQGCSAAKQPGRSWLVQAAPRRRLSVQGGLVAGGRYNHVASTLNLDEYEFLDSQLHPMGGLFAEIFLPGRTTSIYGELTASRFQGRQRLYSIAMYNGLGTGPISYSFSYTDYAAWLGEARIGIRNYAPLRHNQQLVLGLSYGLDKVFRPQFSTVTTGSNSSPTVILPAPAGFTANDLWFAPQTLLPALTVGWRAQYLTLTLDGQRCLDDRVFDNSIGGIMMGSAWSARLTASYRLGRNPDVAKLSTPAKP